MYDWNRETSALRNSRKARLASALMVATVLLVYAPHLKAEDKLDFNVRKTWNIEKLIPYQVCVLSKNEPIPFASADAHPDAVFEWQQPHGISDLEAEAEFRKRSSDDIGWDGASHDYFYDEKEKTWFAWDQGTASAKTALYNDWCIVWETRYTTVRYGTADVYRADNNVRKPVVVVAPYRLRLSRHESPVWSADELFDELENYGYYALTALWNAGYDPIVYRYQSPNDGIAYNAEGLEILLNRLRDTSSVTDIGVVGLSMGGVVARYALTRMDYLNQPHKVRAFISYDAPHGGINIPVSLDYNLRRLSEKLNKSGVEDICDLDSDCYEARRDLNYFKSLLGTKTLSELVLLPRSGTSDRNSLLNSLAQMGSYPRRIPSYALANGSQATKQGYPSIDLIMKFRLNSYTNYNFSVWYNDPDYLDNAAGSQGDMYGEFARRVHAASQGTSKLDWIYGDQLNMRRHAFVPTVSAVPSDNPWGWYGTAYGNGNERHMAVTEEHKDTLLEWLAARM